MGHTTITLEWGERVPPGLCHYSKSIPVAPEEAEGLRANSIQYQDVEAAVTVQGVICLMKI